MEILDKDTQKIAVEKVLREMKDTAKIINGWNASWYEQCLDAYCPALYRTPMLEVEELEMRYDSQYLLANVYHPETRIGEPLKKVTLEDENQRKYDVEFGRVDWVGMKSNKSSRNFSFHNNGLIEFSKWLVKGHKNSVKVDYSASFNVLNNDFGLIIFSNQEGGFYNVTLQNNSIVLKHSDVEITYDLVSATRSVIISSETDIDADEVEKEIIDMVKMIKGELPLPGLIERINFCLKIIDNRDIMFSNDVATLRRLLPNK